jgi:hypothetical protein
MAHACRDAHVMQNAWAGCAPPGPGQTSEMQPLFLYMYLVVHALVALVVAAQTHVMGAHQVV